MPTAVRQEARLNSLQFLLVPAAASAEHSRTRAQREAMGKGRVIRTSAFSTLAKASAKATK